MKNQIIYPSSALNLINMNPIKDIKNRNQIFNELRNGFDMSSINLELLTREELLEYAYALDWNGNWEDDEDGQLPITKEELIDAINEMIEDK